MKLAANFYRPLAIGAPLPLRELPDRSTPPTVTSYCGPSTVIMNLRWMVSYVPFRGAPLP